MHFLKNVIASYKGNTDILILTFIKLIKVYFLKLKKKDGRSYASPCKFPRPMA